MGKVKRKPTTPTNSFCRKTKPKSKKPAYTEETLQKAIQDIQNGMSKKATAKKYNIPRTTIIYRLSDDFKKPGFGPPTILTKDEENLLVKWICVSTQKGFSQRKDDLKVSVKGFIEETNRKTPFVDNMPGDGWYKAFLRRHPEIVERTSEAVTAASACVQEADIRKWFSQITEALIEESVDLEILKDPSRI